MPTLLNSRPTSWSLADLLRGDFKQSQYGRVILPVTILRRLECVLEKGKPAVLKKAGQLEGMGDLEDSARDKFLRKASKKRFYNTSEMSLAKLGTSDIKTNLMSYVDSFSTDAREIFEYFKFGEFVAALDDANLLFKVVQRVSAMDLSPETITNHDMGVVFEELIRKFAESSNETIRAAFPWNGPQKARDWGSPSGRPTQTRASTSPVPIDRDPVRWSGFESHCSKPWAALPRPGETAARQ